MPDAALKVLVTGSSGLIGGVVIRTLGDKYAFSGLGSRPTPGTSGIWHTQRVSSGMRPRTTPRHIALDE
jgi:hypothetical protein